ncbi:DET1 [Chionoecetes opilio]|uniref:DET1 n=1 Tax=Chionoecetes opilio TaxID=41210 RepID=A0A8J4XU40_CHIOP|nr:DET1 [Chionoecetes opilio]
MSITPDGYFLDVRTIGRVCYEDDDYLLATVCTDRMQRTYHHMREKIINSLKHRLLVFLYKRAETISQEEGSPRALREFFHYFDHLLRLRMWKMQLLDDVHLLIKVRY